MAIIFDILTLQNKHRRTLTDQDKISHLYSGPSIDASYQVSVHFAKRFQRRISKSNNRNKNCLWRPCLLTDRNKMSNLNRGPFIDASTQVSIHLAKRFQRWSFRNWLIRNKNFLWPQCLLTDRNEMRRMFFF